MNYIENFDIFNPSINEPNLFSNAWLLNVKLFLLTTTTKNNIITKYKTVKNIVIKLLINWALFSNEIPFKPRMRANDISIAFA